MLHFSDPHKKDSYRGLSFYHVTNKFFHKQKEEMRKASLPSSLMVRHSLRWHYPNQVTGRNESVSSQPASASSLFLFHRCYYNALLYKMQSFLKSFASFLFLADLLFYFSFHFSFFPVHHFIGSYNSVLFQNFSITNCKI